MPTDSTNQTTEYTYDGSNHVTSMTAVMPSGEYSQTTTYVYGVTTLTGSDIDSNDLLYAVEYPNPANGSSGSQFIFNHVDYGGSGVTGNSSGYTEGDPNAPQGSQVGQFSALLDSISSQALAPDSIPSSRHELDPLPVGSPGAIDLSLAIG